MNLEIDSEAVIKRVRRHTMRPFSCKCEGGNRASWEIHMEAVPR